MHLDSPLSEKEFDELDKFLLSDRCADDGMTMDSLHGYLTAIVIGPEMIPLAEWLPQVWGESSEGRPAFKTPKEYDRVVGLITRFLNEIAITMEVAPKEFEPLFCQYEWEGQQILDGEAWAWGFWEGMQLRAAAWAPVWDSNLAEMMRPIYLLGAEEIEEEEMHLVDTPLKAHKMTVQIEAAIPHVLKFWADVRKSGGITVQRDAPKTGRNEDCPCGSGKKFKKCCGVE